jgi:hypothetical protein
LRGSIQTTSDFEELVTSECDALDRLRKILRAARWVEGQAKALKDMEAEMKERRQRFDAKAETLRSIVKTALVSLDMKRLDSPDFTITISPGKPRVVITDEAEIPSQLCKVVRTPDKESIRKALEAGEVIPGAELVALQLPS